MTTDPTSDPTNDPTTPAQLRGLFTVTLTDEPALTDLVPDAVAGARASKRRERIAYAATPFAILGLAVGAYAAVPPGGHPQISAVSQQPTENAVKPSGTPKAAHTPKAAATPKAPDTSENSGPDGIPPLLDLFAHPGTPEENCQQATFPDPTNPNVPAPDQAKERAKCTAYLSALRALLPNDTVVLDHEFFPVTSAGFKVQSMTHDLVTATAGTKLPEFAKGVVQILNDPKNPDNGAKPENFLVKTPTGVVSLWFDDGRGQGGAGSGVGDCKDGKGTVGGASIKPCSNVTLADGTPATFVEYANGVIQIVVDKGVYGDQFWFSVGPSNRDTVGNTYQDNNTGRWMDLKTGTVHDGNRPDPGAFTKNDLLSLTGSQGFLTLYKQIAKDSTGH